MTDQCSEGFSYFNTSDFLSTAFHCLTIIEIPVHFYVGYLILFKTPKRMGNVKWFMFNVHFWSALLDISLSVLVIPYMLFPVAAGYALGFFTWIGINPAIQTTVIVVEIGLTVISILVLFENRYTFLAMSTKCWARFRKTTIICLYFVALFYFIPFNFLVPNQSEASAEVVRRLSTLRCFYSGPIFVLSFDSTLVAWTTAFKLFFEFSYIGVLVLLTFNNIINQTKKRALSQHTMNLQRKFFVSITIQTVIPVAVIILPLVYCAFSSANNFYNQAMNNIAFLIISSHGLISTIAILLIHEPYREATLINFGIKINRVRTTSISFVRSFHD